MQQCWDWKQLHATALMQKSNGFPSKMPAKLKSVFIRMSSILRFTRKHPKARENKIVTYKIGCFWKKSPPCTLIILFDTCVIWYNFNVFLAIFEILLNIVIFAIAATIHSTYLGKNSKKLTCALIFFE